MNNLLILRFIYIGIICYKRPPLTLQLLYPIGFEMFCWHLPSFPGFNKSKGTFFFVIHCSSSGILYSLHVFAYFKNFLISNSVKGVQGMILISDSFLRLALVMVYG